MFRALADGKAGEIKVFTDMDDARLTRVNGCGLPRFRSESRETGVRSTLPKQDKHPSGSPLR